MRLTQKNEYFKYVLPEQNVMGDNQASEISLGETEYTCKKYIIGEAIKKLGELEDVLEEFELTSAEDLRNHLNFQDNMAIWEGELNYKNKIADLEQELSELKQKAIVLEKAFELACNPRDDWCGEKYSGTEFNNYHDYFIAEAEQKLAEIGGKNE